jgi:hypothetical protein
VTIFNRRSSYGRIMTTFLKTGFQVGKISGIPAEATLKRFTGTRSHTS